MNFLADESIDKPIVEALRRKDFIVGYVSEMEPGISDDDVLRLANREKALFEQLIGFFSVITPLGIRIRQQIKDAS